MNASSHSTPHKTTVDHAPSGKTLDEDFASFEAELVSAWCIAREKLGSEQVAESHWVGELSTSALSTATAVSAMWQMAHHKAIEPSQLDATQQAIDVGCNWLFQNQNDDGGFGDTDLSHSNIATTFLCIAAWEMAGKKHDYAGSLEKAWEYVKRQGMWDGLRKRYGKDKTFVVPILSNCALAGLVPWSDVPALPFEAACLPQDWYRWAQMPVVSYAIPALVAIGQARFYFAPPRNPVQRFVRRKARMPTLEVLRRMQPASGGYLEAVPLTSFVLMSLAAIGDGGLPVAQDCLRFLLDSRLSDGSWPIDTNLATWVTSLSVTALARREHQPIRLFAQPLAQDMTEATHDGDLSTTDEKHLKKHRSEQASLVTTTTIRWLLRCQHKQRHPFTGANPGGWGWTDLSGAVPDADDTPAALLALASVDLSSPQLVRLRNEVHAAVVQGLQWLLRLQNHDGGWPTFCRGWGKLPFDRSGTDLTAHAIRAIIAWQHRLQEMGDEIQCDVPSDRKLNRAIDRGRRFLQRTQAEDGSWLPLWFGNQDRPEEDNPFYGTGKVLLAYSALGEQGSSEARRGIAFLRSCQNDDGGWGGGSSVRSEFHSASTARPAAAPQVGGVALRSENGANTLVNRSTIEETAVALEGLLLCGGDPRQDATIMRALRWLITMIKLGELDRSWPIGFYFAKLWYHERTYPTIFGLAALGAGIQSIAVQRNSICTYGLYERAVSPEPGA